MDTDLLYNACKNLPDTIYLAGFAINRQTYFNNADTPMVPTSQEYFNGYNWGAACSGSLRLAYDVLLLCGMSEECADYLKHTLSGNVIEHLPDNFEISLKMHEFFGDAYATNLDTTPTEIEGTSYRFSSEYVTVLRVENPDYVTITKDIPQTLPEEASISAITETDADDETVIVKTATGWYRTPKLPTDRAKKAIEMLNEFREEGDKLKQDKTQ